MGLNFSYVTMDCWYFCKDMTAHIEGLGKSWIAEAKSNRLVWYNGKWRSLLYFANEMIGKYNFKVANIGDESKYYMKVFTVKMKEIGTVRLLVSLNKHGNFKFYVSNRLDWKELSMMKHDYPRWDIEVWHREGKGNYGIEDCLLRSRRRGETYSTLSSLTANFLGISSMLFTSVCQFDKTGMYP